MGQHIAAKQFVADETNVTITALEPTDEAMDGYKDKYDSTAAVFQKVTLRLEHVEALISGKILALDDGEFVIFLSAESLLSMPKTYAALSPK